MRIPRLRSGLAIVGVVTLVAFGAPAYAAPTDETDAAAAAVSAVAPTDLTASEIEVTGDELAAQLTGGGEVALSFNPAEGIAVTTSTGDEGLSVSLPGASNLGEADVAADGSVTYTEDEQTASVNVLATGDGLRISTVIDSSLQEEHYAYDFGGGVVVEVNEEDGSALAYIEEEITDPETGTTHNADRIIANIAAPWAKDANGVDVKTHYVAEGSVLIQVVAHRSADVAYPVVADPYYDQPNIIQHRIRFNRAETAAIAGGGLAALSSIGCGPMWPVCALAWGTIVWNASVAQNSSPKKCVQITATVPYVVPGIVWWVDQFSGGVCR
jgi:hypothetical protein